MLQGAAIGLVACFSLAWLTGASLPGCQVALMWGGCIGALIGLLLWVGSAEAPEDPVLPPAPGQGRSLRWGKPRERR